MTPSWRQVQPADAVSVLCPPDQPGLNPRTSLLPQVEEARIHIQDPELRKILSLTTADLRFADYLVKHVTENRDDVFLDGTGWEGGDEWIRAQFTLYLHSLLSSALQQGGESAEHPIISRSHVVVANIKGIG